MTFYILRNNGAKINAPEQLLKLRIDPKVSVPEMVIGSREHKEWFKKIQDRVKGLNDKNKLN